MGAEGRPGPDARREVRYLQRHCSRDGCPNSFPDHRFGTIRAAAGGWFISREKDEAWCPDDLPDWVAGWRAKKAAEQFRAEGAWGQLPAVLKCEQGDLADAIQPDPDPDAWAEKKRALRDMAFRHARLTGHVVTIIEAASFTVRPS